MPLRMLGYGSQALTDFVARTGHRNGPVPTLIPLVLYQGPGPWTAPRRLSELHALPGTIDPGPFWIDIELIVHELGEDHRGLLRAAKRMTALARAALTLMKLVATRRSLHPHAKLVATMLDQVRTSDGPRALRPLFVYLVGTRGHDHDLDVIMQSLDKETQVTALTLLEQLEARGFVRGEARGFVRGEAALLLKQLRMRFGVIPTEIVERVRSAEVSMLDRWAERLLSNVELDEIFAG